MATAPITITFRGARRIRTLFSGALAAGAFVSAALYTFTNTDGSAANPINVVAVFAIAGKPNEVEIAVDSDLTSGALYTIGFVAVPCADLTNYTGTYAARVGMTLAPLANSEPAASDFQLHLYGRDLLFHNDFIEDATGDLGAVVGRPNWLGAITRRLGSQGLGWDRTYGLLAEQYVDAPDPYQKGLAGQTVAQATADDRTASASVSVVQSVTDPNSWYFQLMVSGRDQLDPAVITVPTI
jgi:hypothetical protein